MLNIMETISYIIEINRIGGEINSPFERGKKLTITPLNHGFEEYIKEKLDKGEIDPVETKLYIKENRSNKQFDNVTLNIKESKIFNTPEEAVTAFKNMFTGFTDYLLSSKYVNLKIIQLKIEKSYSYIDYSIK